MDDHQETESLHNESQEEIESESGSSYAGSDLSPDKDQFPPVSSQRGRIHHSTRLESRHTSREAPSSQMEGSGAGGEDEQPVTETHVSHDIVFEENQSIEEGSTHKRRSISSAEQSQIRSPNRDNSNSSASESGRHSHITSATQSPYNMLHPKANLMIMGASTSTPALSSAVSEPSTGAASPVPQASSTVDPNQNMSSASAPSRDDRDVVLPRWQPDAEVTYCPICSTQFSFFVRKHHCRKCGRVVCNSCSPHRITIPFQFIVQPLVEVFTPTGPQLRPERESLELESVLADRHGGMKVRLCNPCVPDPNTHPPQHPGGDWRGGAQPTYYLNSGNLGYLFGEEAMNNLERRSNSLARNTPNRARGMSAESGLTASTSREQQISGSAYMGRTGNTILNHSVFPADHNSRYSNQTASHTSRPVSYVGPSQPTTIRGHTRGNQSLSFNPTGSAPNPQTHHLSLLEAANQRLQGLNLDSRPLPAVPRIPEEDECPVCHRELPSRTLPSFEDVRAAHVTQCIEDQIAIHNGQVRPGAFSSQSQPSIASSTSRSNSPQSHATITTNASNVLVLPSASSRVGPPIQATIANTPEARMAAREAAHAAVVLGLSQANSPSGESYRRTGMFLYKASEKDCVDDAECTICLEEFEVAVGMARLECLCRFHAKCIQEWFVDHPGRCPVHQHDGYGF